ncbi:universal stress protein, partial [bacterium]
MPASGETPSVRVALGVDLQRAYVPAAALLEAMRFPGGHVTLIHVASEHPPIAVEHGVEGLDQRYFDETERLGRAALEEAGAILSAMGLTVECRIVRDLAARGLVTTSEAEEIDVVAVNAERKPVIGVNAVGSVTAGITSAPRICLLIAKGERQNRGFLRAVLATDHSPCANACLDRFLALAPKGITEILVLCPWEIEEDDAERVAR